MKTPLQFIVSLIALGTLLSGPAYAATAVADKPLKASVAAKPNVIFGMDDSGSMDWEVLLDTGSGKVWWNGTRAWDTIRNKPLATSSFYSYSYLMPVGQDVGGQIYEYNSTAGLALPPTNEFAWLRSPTFNPLYYDTTVTYRKWADAYFDKASQTYTNAAANGAWSHPNYTSGPSLRIGVKWESTGNANFNRDGYRFYVQEGMTLPAGTVVSSSSRDAGGTPCGGDTRELRASQTVPANKSCWASIPYFPATFWNAETCTIGADCVARPDGLGTLKRYEISGSKTFPSNRSVADELQNFANWFSYYRKRKLMLASSMGKVMEGINGLYMGVAPFNVDGDVRMYDADSSTAADNGQAIAGFFYTNAMAGLATPTHETIDRIGKQYDTNTNIVRYACQRNNTFIVTDGFSNTATFTPPAWQSGRPDYGGSSPYSVTTTGTQADLALRYYTNRLRVGSLAADKVKRDDLGVANADRNPDLHVNFYAITLGVRGTLWPSATDPFTIAPTWTVPVADDPSLIDDLWHATINGRGKMYLASTPEQTAANIQAGLDDIRRDKASQGGIGVSSVNLRRGDSTAYYGAYDPANWSGDLRARDLDPIDGTVGEEVWSADELLRARAWTERVIASSTGAGVVFDAAAVGALVNPSATYGSNADVIGYLRGDRSKETSPFRRRSSLMGAVINSEPAIDRDSKVAYIQSGEGMLHAFDIDKKLKPGKELWAFVPRSVLGSIGATTQRNYVFHTLLDGTPAIGKFSDDDKLLVAGRGVGGRSFHALNVTSPRGLTEAALASNVKWEFPALDATAALKGQVGLAVGRPLIVKTTSNDYVVVLTSGYNNSDGIGRVWMLNADTGAVLKTFTLTGGTLANESGLAQLAAFGETDGTVRYVYGGDLRGNVWRFDLEADGETPEPFQLAVLKDASNNRQPITAAPDVATKNGKRIIAVGTGRLLDVKDFGNSRVQSMYVITDDAATISTLSDVRASLVERTHVHGSSSVTGASAALDSSSSGRGWFVDIAAGEQVNTRPVIVDGALAWVGNKTGATDCSASAYIYVMDLLTGGVFAKADFVSKLLSDKANFSALTALGTDEGTALTGQDYERGVPPPTSWPTGSIGARKNSWIEIRR